MKLHIILKDKSRQEMRVEEINQELLAGNLSRDTKAWTGKVWDSLENTVFEQYGIRMPPPPLPEPPPPPNYDDLLKDIKRDLPALSPIIASVLKAISQPDPTMQELSESIKPDSGLTTAVLRIANAPFFRMGERRRVRNPEDAIGRIGIERFKEVVLRNSIFPFFKGSSTKEEFTLFELWKHSFGVGETCRVIAKHLNDGNGNDPFARPSQEANVVSAVDHDIAYICGLLHDIGKVALYVCREDKFIQSLNDASDRETDLLAAEIRNQSYRHDEVGYLMCKKWGLDEQVAYTIGKHHEPNQKERGSCPTDPDLDTYSEEERALRQMEYEKETHKLVDIVLLANWMIHDLKFGFSGHRSPTEPSKELLARLNLDQGMTNLRDRVESELEETKKFVEMLENKPSKKEESDETEGAD